MCGILVITLPQVELTEQHTHRHEEQFRINLGTVIAISELEHLAVCIPCRHWISCRILIRKDIGNEPVYNILACEHWRVHDLLGCTMSEDWLGEIRHVVVVDGKLQICPCTHTLYCYILRKHQLDVVLLECGIDTCKVDIAVVDYRVVVLYIEVLVAAEVKYRTAQLLYVDDSL